MNKKQKNHKPELVHHLFTGIFLMVKGIDKIGHHYPMIGCSIILFGVIIVAYCIYEMARTKHSLALKLMVHIFESAVMLFTTYVFADEGKVYLPYATALASLFFLIAAIIIWRKGRKQVHST